MTSQTIRAGCTSCEPDGTHDCPGAPEVGTPADGAAYRPEVEPEVAEFEYFWNRSGQLAGAVKWVDGLEKLTMSYLYDASGARVVRTLTVTGDWRTVEGCGLCTPPIGTWRWNTDTHGPTQTNTDAPGEAGSGRAGHGRGR